MQLFHFPLLSNFDQCLVKRFANENLQYRPSLQFEVENRLSVNINLLVDSVGVGNEYSNRSAVNVKVRLNIIFISLARVVWQFFPVVDVSLLPVRRRFRLVRLNILLRSLKSKIHILTYRWVSTAPLFLLLSWHLFGLHVYWDDKCSKSIATDDSPVIHDVLRSDFSEIFSINLGLTWTRGRDLCTVAAFAVKVFDPKCGL